MEERLNMDSLAVVLFHTLPTASGGFIGVATLNVEKTLNSLSLEMIELLTPQLEAWKNDDQIKMVMFQSAGDRAFSAGGDIQSLYHSMVEHPKGPSPYADAFFESEYRLDYLIHTYPKPTIVWAHGFVMGGGLGVMGACSQRIGTEKTRVAMPEITIGLFPDAGATWMCNQMETHWAYFLAWTGSQVNGPDAKHLHFVDHLIDYDLKSRFVEALQNGDWASDVEARLMTLIEKFESESQAMPERELPRFEALVKQIIDKCLQSENPVQTFSDSLGNLTGDRWLEKAAANFKGGSPTTAQIIHQQLQRSKTMSLKETFLFELIIAVQCSRHPDFVEGVRALLIDKDNKPVWAHAEMGRVPESWVNAHFEAPWHKHPLEDLVG
jgi:enoyl-CoA hydratase/carnithine racemase